MTAPTHVPEVPEASSGLDVDPGVGRARGGGIPAALLVSAIAVLVVVVSMPRFRAHVLDANRKDARVAIGLLSRAVFQNSLPEGLPLTAGQSTPAGGLEMPNSEEGGVEPGLYDFVRNVKRLRHRFPDARPSAMGGEMLHHGYRFATGYVHKDLVEHAALVAWPDRYGKSGDVAFAAMGDGSIYGHLNHGLWSGEDRTGARTSTGAEPLPGGSQALFHVDLSDESWVLVKAPD